MRKLDDIISNLNSDDITIEELEKLISDLVDIEESETIPILLRTLKIAISAEKAKDSFEQQTFDAITNKVDDILSGIQSRPSDYFKSSDEITDKLKSEIVFLPKQKEERYQATLKMGFKSIEKAFSKIINNTSSSQKKAALKEYLYKTKKLFLSNPTKRMLKAQVKQLTAEMNKVIKDSSLEM